MSAVEARNFEKIRLADSAILETVVEDVVADPVDWRSQLKRELKNARAVGIGLAQVDGPNFCGNLVIARSPKAHTVIPLEIIAQSMSVALEIIFNFLKFIARNSKQASSLACALVPETIVWNKVPVEALKGANLLLAFEDNSFDLRAPLLERFQQERQTTCRELIILAEEDSQGEVIPSMRIRIVPEAKSTQKTASLVAPRVSVDIARLLVTGTIKAGDSCIVLVPSTQGPAIQLKTNLLNPGVGENEIAFTNAYSALFKPIKFNEEFLGDTWGGNLMLEDDNGEAPSTEIIDYRSHFEHTCRETLKGLAYGDLARGLAAEVLRVIANDAPVLLPNIGSANIFKFDIEQLSSKQILSFDSPKGEYLSQVIATSLIVAYMNKLVEQLYDFAKMYKIDQPDKGFKHLLVFDEFLVELFASYSRSSREYLLHPLEELTPVKRSGALRPIQVHLAQSLERNTVELTRALMRGGAKRLI